MVWLSGVVLSFAVWATVQVSIGWALFSRRPPQWGWALVLPPLGLSWALRAKMYVRVGLWIVSLATYGVCWFALE